MENMNSWSLGGKAGTQFCLVPLITINAFAIFLEHKILHFFFFLVEYANNVHKLSLEQSEKFSP